MQRIDVSLEVYKALTNRLRHDQDSYDEVLRELLQIDSVTDPEVSSGNPLLAAIDTLMGSGSVLKVSYGPGFVSRSLHLPEGSKLRARYKGKVYFAEIKGEKWIDENGLEQLSPSAAAKAITGNNVNGLRFWQVNMPRDGFWRRLDTVR